MKKNKKRRSKLLRTRKTMRSPLNLNRLIWRKRNAYKLKRKLDRKNGSIKSKATLRMRISLSFHGTMNALFLSPMKKLSRSAQSNC